MGKGKPDKNKDTAKQQDKPGRGARNQKLDPAMFGLGGQSTLGGLGQLGAAAGLTSTGSTDAAVSQNLQQLQLLLALTGGGNGNKKTLELEPMQAVLLSQQIAKGQAAEEAEKASALKAQQDAEVERRVSEEKAKLGIAKGAKEPQSADGEGTDDDTASQSRSQKRKLKQKEAAENSRAEIEALRAENERHKCYRMKVEESLGKSSVKTPSGYSSDGLSTRTRSSRTQELLAKAAADAGLDATPLTLADVKAEAAAVATATAKQELESARKKVSIASPEKSILKPSPAKSLQSVNSEGELSDFAKKLKAKAEAKAKEKQTKKEKTLNAAERAQAMTALLKSELDEVGKAAKSEHAELDAEDMDELSPIVSKIAKLYEGRGQQVKTALVEGLGNTYGFSMARKETLDSFIAKMVGTLLLHGRDVTASARFVELVPHVKKKK
jgi:hypothetical protein